MELPRRQLQTGTPRGHLAAPPCRPRPRFGRCQLAPRPARSECSPPGYIRNAPQSLGTAAVAELEEGRFFGARRGDGETRRQRAARAPKRRAHHLRGVPSGTAAPLTWRLLSVHAGSPRDGTGQGAAGLRLGLRARFLSAARCHTAPRMLPGVSIPHGRSPTSRRPRGCSGVLGGCGGCAGRAGAELSAERGAGRGAERRQRPLRAAGAARSFRGGGPAPPAPPPLQGSAALPRG